MKRKLKVTVKQKEFIHDNKIFIPISNGMAMEIGQIKKLKLCYTCSCFCHHGHRIKRYLSHDLSRGGVDKCPGVDNLTFKG